MTAEEALRHNLKVSFQSRAIGDIYYVLQYFGVAPEMRLLNCNGEYKDRFRKKLGQGPAIKLEVGVRSNIDEFPLEELSEFIRHLEMIVEDAKVIKKFLEDNGVTEKNNVVEGIEEFADKMSDEVVSTIGSDPMKYREVFNEKNRDSIRGNPFWNLSFGSITNSIINYVESSIQGE